ncbi:MAG: PqqD family protein [Desulfotomaculales bacterium]
MVRWRRRSDVKVRDTSAAFIIYDHRSGTYLEMNESARAIWLLLDGRTTEEIVEEFRILYDVDRAVARDDVHEVLRILEENGFVSRAGMAECGA